MRSFLGRWLLRHPFFALGLLTLALFLGVEALRVQGAIGAAEQLAVPLRIIIVPMYLVWLGLTMAYVALLGPESPGTILRIAWAALQFTGGLVPYLAADYLLARARRHITDSHGLKEIT